MLETFINYGFVSRIVVTHPRQVTQWIELISYRLTHLLYYVFKSATTKHGYINLSFNSVTASFATGFPEEARHEVLISPISFAESTHMVMSPTKVESDVQEDLAIVRSFFLAK